MSEDFEVFTCTERRRQTYDAFVWTGRSEDTDKLPYWAKHVYRPVEVDGVLCLAHDGSLEEQDYDAPDGWAHRRKPEIWFVRAAAHDNGRGYQNYSGTWFYAPGVVILNSFVGGHMERTSTEFADEFEVWL